MKKENFIYYLFLLVLIMSCSAEQKAAIDFEREIFIIKPGITAEIKCIASFEDLDQKTNPNRNSLKRFSEEPIVTIMDDEINLLSCTPNVTKTDVVCLLLVRADKNRLSGKRCKIKISWGGLSTSADILTKKDPADYIGADGIITDEESYDALINKQRSLSPDYVPPDLVKIKVATVLDNAEVNMLRKVASDALSSLVSDAEKEGCDIQARSGYRSYKTQKALFDYYVKRDGEESARKFSAVPGTSEHQSGLAIDVTSPAVNLQLVQSYGETTEGKWLRNNAHRFGFIIRYPKDKQEITGYAYEPWHLRYIGKDAALEIYLEEICLEEYFQD